MRNRQISSINDLSRAERRALEGIDMMHGTNGVTMQTLRANGNRRDVVERVCELGLAFAAGAYGNRDLVRFALSNDGRKILADAEAVREAHSQAAAAIRQHAEAGDGLADDEAESDAIAVVLRELADQHDQLADQAARVERGVTRPQPTGGDS